MHFQDSVVWITGASAGIGEALAYELAGRGARLILSSRNPSLLEAVKNRCGLPADAVRVLPLDLADLDALSDMAREALGYFGRIDVLVNNGGVGQRSLVKDTALSVERRIMTVNYLGQIALTKAVLPSMLDRGRGHIVVVSSIFGKMASPLRSSYCASKYALHGFFDAVRAETWRDGLRVTIVCPASITTGISLAALTGDGSPYGIMDDQQAGGMSPARCARRIVRAAEKEKEEVLIGPPIRHVAHIKRFFPGLYNRAIRKVKMT